MRITKDPWIYGECDEHIARKHYKKGNVQFILWRAGDQGYDDNFWHNMDSSWWPQFKSYNPVNPIQKRSS